jgi:hypothetical protein
MSDKKTYISFNLKLPNIIGLNETIFLSKLKEILEDETKDDIFYIAESWWYKSTYQNWVIDFFEFWSEKTIMRIVNSLKKKETCKNK